jgi:hypothetical protein
MFNHYDIKDTDTFEESVYPGIVKEIEALQETMLEIKGLHKIEIIISFLRFHSIKTEWISTNKDVTRLMTSRSVGTSELEELFDSSKKNSGFSNELESYIKAKLTALQGMDSLNRRRQNSLR